MIDYDAEAAGYDRTRGGPERADAAARAIRALLPDDAELVLDVAGGTGIVGERLGRTVVSVDRSLGMSKVAATRLPGRVVRGDAAVLPIASGSVDAVTMIWLPHLLDAATVALVITEAARVLRPGGTLITTVHKSRAQAMTPDDVGALLGPWWRRHRGTPTDDPDRITELAAGHGLRPAGRATFVGVGQGRSPRAWLRLLGDTAPPGLADLPDQDRPRADPEYQLAAFSRERGRFPYPAA